MSNFIKTQNSFANGEVAPEFFANDEIRGLAYLENMDVVPGGGLARRPGLEKIATLNSNAKLISFSASETKNYILALGSGYIKMFLNGTLAQSIAMPWSDVDLDILQYAERFGTMIFVHPDYIPQVLYWDTNRFKLRDFTFSTSDGYNADIPFMRFEDTTGITISTTYSDNKVHFITSEPFWTRQHLYGYFSLLGKTWTISEYISSTDVVAACNGAYNLPTDPISDWQEAAFSRTRGWPCSITFHQDRLVFGGAKSWPAGIWMSCVGKHDCFNLGTGLDDEAIYLTLISDKSQQICALASSNSLQVLTSEGEWVISNIPLTPSSVDIRMHTAIGSNPTRYFPPQKMEDATIFVSNRDIRELALDDLGEKYNANNLSLLAYHLVKLPCDIAYNKKEKRLYVVLESGDMAVLNRDTGLGILAWGRYTTTGLFKSVGVCGNETYVVVARNNNFTLEKFSEQCLSDSETYTYTMCATGMPIRVSGHNVHALRIKKITVGLLDSKTLNVNGQSFVFPNDVYEIGASGYTGDATVNLLGTKKDFSALPWTISCNDTMPLKILSVTVYGRYQI